MKTDRPRQQMRLENLWPSRFEINHIEGIFLTFGGPKFRACQDGYRMAAINEPLGKIANHGILDRLTPRNHAFFGSGEYAVYYKNIH